MKKIKNKSKFLVIILIIILLVTAICILLLKNNQKEQIVIIQEDGTRINNSSKIKEIKKFGGLDIKNITITEKGNEIKITADVRNFTDQVKGDYPILIKLLDKEGKEILGISGYLNRLTPGNNTKIDATINSKNKKLVEAYDLIFEDLADEEL